MIVIVFFFESDKVTIVITVANVFGRPLYKFVDVAIFFKFKCVVFWQSV